MKRKILLSGLCIFLFIHFLPAQTWNGSVNTDWNTAANWLNNQVPLPRSKVIIPNTPNKPVLANNINIGSFIMAAGSSLDFNGFTLSTRDSVIISGATLNNSNANTDIILTIATAGSAGTSYIEKSTINGNIILNYQGNGPFYEGYADGNDFNGNTTLNISGMGPLYTAYISNLGSVTKKSSYQGNLVINRTVAGVSHLLFWGSKSFLKGNFTYINSGGGATIINENNRPLNIPGTINITATGPGKPVFSMMNIKNATPGGTILIQNSGDVYINQDTLLIDTLNVSGFTVTTPSYSIPLVNNFITGYITLSDDPANTGGIYIYNNTIVGDASYSVNSSASVSDRDNSIIGNTDFQISGKGPAFIAGTLSLYNGNLTIHRTGEGMTSIFDGSYSYHNRPPIQLTGNLNYTNNAGGQSYFNVDQKSSPEVITIGGRINITADGPGNPDFGIRYIENLTPGDSISVQNSGTVNIQGNSLLLTALNINGFASSGDDYFVGTSITGNVTFSEDAANSGNVYVTANTINGNSAFTLNGPTTWYESYGYGSRNVFNGNATFARNAGTLNLAYNDTTYVNQDLVFNADSGISIGNAIEFGGASDGIIEQLGTQPVIIPKLVMNKTAAAKVTLNDSVTISTSLNLMRGNIVSGANSPLSIPDNVTYKGGSDTSYVDGPVLKTGNDAFTFPLGQNNVFAPITITAPANITDQFRAQYFAAAPDNAGYNSSKHDPSLNHISSKEYWLLDRTAGTSNAKVTLSWDQRRSGAVTGRANLRVARWNGAMWKDEGNGGTTGGNIKGIIQSLNSVSGFSPFTLASANSSNPLPITLLNFAAQKCGSNACLQWSTENEKNFSHFEIERAKADNNFTLAGSVKANNDPLLNKYTYTDEGASEGVNFYRLKMIDVDGSFKYSEVIPVAFNIAAYTTIYPNPARDEIRILTSKNVTSVEITDLSGELIKRMVVNSANLYKINELQKGLYIIKISSSDNTTVSKKLVVE